MSVELASEIWNLVRDNLTYDDKEQIAESLVGILLDYGYDLEDIKQEFTDSDIKQAIKYFSDEDSEEYSNEDEIDYSDESDDENW
jgi:hypothetical protein